MSTGQIHGLLSILAASVALLGSMLYLVWTVKRMKGGRMIAEAKLEAARAEAEANEAREEAARSEADYWKSKHPA